MFTEALLYGLAGAFAGLMSGILGIGGGVVVVPALLFIFELSGVIPESLAMHMAAGSSLAIIVFTSFAAVRAHYRIEPILWWVYQRLWLGIVIGTTCGVVIASHLSMQILRNLFGVFLLLVAYKMATSKDRGHRGHFPSPWVNRFVTLFIGLCSGLLGVGGGIMIIPYLTYCGIDPRRIAPISSLCTMTVAWIGTITFMFSAHEVTLPQYATGYVYWPAVLCAAITSVLFAPMGAKLSYILPLKVLRYVFVVILLLTAIGLCL